MGNSLDFKGLAESLLLDAHSLLPQWLPGGKFQGKNYICANLQGGKGESLSFNLSNGFGSDFATGDKFGDMIALYAAINGLSQGEAFVSLGGEKKSTIVPDFKHPTFNILPVAMWKYLSPAGNPLMAVARYEGPEGRTFVPWSINSSGWKPKSLPAPRPLYGLNLLEANKLAPVLVVEGEKATEAARLLCPSFVVVTWSFGAQAWNKSEWSVLFGRSSIVLWPDADDPGKSAMTGISELLASHCRSVKILDVSDMPVAWDAADALDEGMSPESVLLWIEKTSCLPRKMAFVTETMAEMLARPEPELEWLIKGLWVSKARGLIAGNPGVGKTWLALDMLFSVSTGQICLGKFTPAKQMPVLLIEEEASLLNLARRVHAMARGRGLKDSDLVDFHHITRQFLKIPTHEAELSEFILSKGIGLVVFDSLRRFHGAEENSSSEMQPVLDSFARLNAVTGASLVLIHHLAKSGGDGGKKPLFERLRGTSDLWAWRDCLIGVEGEENAEVALLSFQFRDAETPVPLILKRIIDPLSGAITLEAQDITESDDFQQKCDLAVKFVQSQYGGAYKTDIAEALSGRKKDNLRAVTLMEKNGILVAGLSRKLEVPVS
jgi:hypothetical protein